jgi:outer membrane assembly lipoprotein YfiO
MRKFLLFSTLLLLSCGGKKRIVYETPGEQFDAALLAFERGKYSEALEGFKRVLYEFPTGPYTDDAQYYLGECYLKMKDYDLAKDEFRFLIDNFPTSEYVERATLGLAKCYMYKNPDPSKDQSDTKEAISILRRFLSRYPDSPLRGEAKTLLKKAKNRLAEKMLIAAKTYKSLGAYEAEKFYLQLLIKEFPNSDVIWEAKYMLGEVLLRLGEVDSAMKNLREIVASVDAPTQIKEKAKNLMNLKLY